MRQSVLRLNLKQRTLLLLTLSIPILLFSIGASFAQEISVFTDQPSDATRATSTLVGNERRIDIIISLHRTNLTGAQDTAYRNVIGHFADAVYEATEARHKIRNVTVYLQEARSDIADIVWGTSGQPSSQLTGGQGSFGGHINMFDVFLNGGINGNLNIFGTAEDRQKAGYVLAQRWMNYYLGVENEYQESGSDIPVDGSLMNDPFRAAREDNAAFLNLSAPRDGASPFGLFEHTGATQQHRLFGSSAWSAITKFYSIGPKRGEELAKFEFPVYPELVPVFPSPPTAPQTDLGALPGVASRNILSIIVVPNFGQSDSFEIARENTARTVPPGQNFGISPAVIGVGPQTFQFPVEATLSTLNVVVQASNSPTGIDVTLTDSTGVVWAPSGATPTFVQYNLFGTRPAPGLWSLQVASRSGDSEVTFTVSATADRSAVKLSVNATSAMRVGATSNFTLLYPRSLIIQANLNKGLGVSDVDVSGFMRRPNGLIAALDFHDDGIAPDYIANDGTYSAETSYFQNFPHQIFVCADNEMVRGVTTYAGTSLSPGDGDVAGPVVVAPPATLPLPEDFMRTTSISVNVTGMNFDDHANFFQAATPVNANNAEIPGRIDIPGDPDYFSFTANAPTLNVRVARLSNGLNPQLTVYDIDGLTVLNRGATQSGYQLSTISVLQGFTYYASVTDTSSTNFGGSYAFSVGGAVTSDTANVGLSSASRSGGGGGGGGGGCFIATAAYGTPLAEDINVLRSLRDHYLMDNILGATFVDTYYRISPPIADAVARHALIRHAIRVVLIPIIATAQLIATAPWLPLLLFALFLAYTTRRVRRRASRQR